MCVFNCVIFKNITFPAVKPIHISGSRLKIYSYILHKMISFASTDKFHIYDTIKKKSVKKYADII